MLVCASHSDRSRWPATFVGFLQEDSTRISPNAALLATALNLTIFLSAYCERSFAEAAIMSRHTSSTPPLVEFLKPQGNRAHDHTCGVSSPPWTTYVSVTMRNHLFSPYLRNVG